ncbi:MAG: adenylosuccinate synthetase [Lachnospiraceae bacterium]|nr:adenylosuccinate synthetase [Lachnospiraceae bacterium]
MRKQIKVVIGANFGDEGKGLMTDYFCNELSANGSVLNIRHNGGAQAGHTVVTPDGMRHVFSHLGAGSFNPHVATYLSEDFILNPILFCRELEALKKEFSLTPRVYVHPNCRITTPYDMLINQIAEKSLGDQRHGSCGVGINETVVRYNSALFGYPQRTLLSAQNILFTPLDHILTDIRKRYVPARLKEHGVTSLSMEDYDRINSDVLLYKWIDQLHEMLGYCKIVGDGVLKPYDSFVFEGAQGLLLDNDYDPFAPYLTTSKTGSCNPKNILLASGYKDADIEVCYVTRTYFTRHGNGPFPSECGKEELGIEADDQTNRKNEFQGVFRYGRFDNDLFKSAVSFDMAYLAHEFSSLRNTVAFTHVDECGTLIFDLPAPVSYTSYGRTREDIQQIL